MASIATLRRWALWTLLAVSAIAAIEPSPYEAMFFVALLAFAPGGLRFDPSFAPVILCVAVFDGFAFLALVPYVGEAESVSFTCITVYITITALFFAALVAADPLDRLRTIRSGYVFAAMLAAALGVLGYFNVAGLGPYFTVYDGARAMGPFKDPNVFGPFLVAPIVWICQDVLLRRAAPLWSAAKLLVLLIALFLSFSRGAMIDTVSALVMVLGLTFLTSPSPRLRRRVVVVSIVGAVLVAALLLFALAIPSIREVALERATLTEDYDSGEQGRFGNQLRSIPMLLERPFGFGPFRFAKFFPADPHEVFLSAFASFGWAGGIAFAVFVALTLYAGWTCVFRQSRVRDEAIALWAAAFPQILQGVQIDTIHWRHLFLLIGCTFGLSAAARRETAHARRPTPTRGTAEHAATAGA
jgi:hypothetical protein